LARGAIDTPNATGELRIQDEWGAFVPTVNFEKLRLRKCSSFVLMLVQHLTEQSARIYRVNWYEPNANNPPWIKALADVRRMGTLEGYCFHHVQAIMIAIDQYAETALGNRDYFLNRPYSIGGINDKIP
jgi:hypothetical protein